MFARSPGGSIASSSACCRSAKLSIGDVSAPRAALVSEARFPRKGSAAARDGEMHPARRKQEPADSAPARLEVLGPAALACNARLVGSLPGDSGSSLRIVGAVFAP